MISGSFSAAPLDRTAKWVTSLVIVMAAGFPFLPKMPVYAAVVLPLVIFITWLFSVRSYDFMNGTLTVSRPFWETKIKLPPDAEFSLEPDIRKGLIKTAGNGGLFGYTGGFRNKKLGNFKAYATNWDHTVSIISRATGMTIVITPENTEGIL